MKEICEKCGAGISEGPMFRQNVGELPARWRCRRCNALPVDEIVDDIVGIIERDNQRHQEQEKP